MSHPAAPLPPAPPLALYVHIPWCVKKCPYCDFNSHPQRGPLDQRGYVDALLRDLDADLGRYGDARPLRSIFIGGGTPSLFGAAAIDEMLRAVRARLRCDDAIEITMEANPGGVEHDDFAAYRAAGVNRLSLGVQSFNDAHLAALGRIHSAAEAARAIRAAREVFANLNLDLMYGLPQQSPAAALNDLGAALEFSPSHLSLYQLTLEPNTVFHRRPPPLPGDELIAQMQHSLHRQAERRGYHRYEVSAYAQAGRRCRHNLNYWEFGDYLGIGAGAHGKITVDGGGIERYWKQKHPQRYLRVAGGERAIGGRKTTAPREVGFEFLLNALRLTAGVDTALIPAHTGREATEVIELLDDALNRRLVVIDRGRLRCSETGYRFLDEVLQGVLPE